MTNIYMSIPIVSFIGRSNSGKTTLIERVIPELVKAGYRVSGHYGLSMMRERAQAVGPLLSITSHPGHGTELMIRWSQPFLKEIL